MSFRSLMVSCLKSGVYSYDSAVQRISLLAKTEKYANGSKMIWFMLDVSEPTVYGLQMSGLYSLPSRPWSAVIRVRLRGTAFRPAGAPAAGAAAAAGLAASAGLAAASGLVTSVGLAAAAGAAAGAAGAVVAAAAGFAA